MHEVLISLLAWRRELIHEVCISLRRAESPKRDQNLVNGVTLRKTLIFVGKEAGKTGLLRIRGVEIHKKQ